MMMVYNAHLLHRLFAIEKRLNKPGSITSLKQLRQALNSEGSFVSSLADLVRGTGFRLTSPLFRSLAALPLVVPMEVNVDAAVADPTDEIPLACTDLSMGTLVDTSYNMTKLAYMNTEAGVARRRAPGPIHVHASDGVGSHRCMLCSQRTRQYCVNCSKNLSKVKFFVCTRATVNDAGAANISTCFQIFHNRSVLSASTSGRHREITEPQLSARTQNASTARGAQVAKRSKLDDSGHSSGTPVSDKAHGDLAPAADLNQPLPELTFAPLIDLTIPQVEDGVDGDEDMADGMADGSSAGAMLDS